MSDIENRVPHLRTKYVFIDTQALRKARLDWHGKALSKLSEFAKKGQLRLLVTDVTIGEVKSQLRELVEEAVSSVTKHRGLLEQLGGSDVIARLKDQTAALTTLEAAFDQFLKNTNAITLPLTSDVKAVLADYFARQPPFSVKKKSEFPDAISIASVRAWCEKTKSSAYIVSEDADLKACCSEAGPLLHASSIAEIISQATVSHELNEALEKAFRASEYLNEYLVDAIKDLDVDIDNYSSFARSGIDKAKIDRVHSVYVTSVNVLEQHESTFTCEPEIEAEIELEINVGVIEEDYLGPRRRGFSTSQIRTEYFYPEVIVRFDRSTGELDFESISLGTQTVSVSMDDVR